MASLPGLEPPSTRAKRSPSPSTTSTANLGSYIGQESTNVRNTATDPALPDDAKSSFPLLTIKQEPPAEIESYIGQESASARNTASDPSLPDDANQDQKEAILVQYWAKFLCSLGPSLPLLSVKQEPPTERETPPNGNAADSPIPSTSVEAPPGKKPRKNLLQESEPFIAYSSDEEDFIEKKSRKRKKNGSSGGGRAKGETLGNRTRKYPSSKRPLSWNAPGIHFKRHSGVQPGDDKKRTVSDLANEKDALQRANGWKVFYMMTQVDEVIDVEHAVQSQLSALQEFIEDKPAAIQMKPLDMEEEEILSKIKCLTEGSLQQSKILQDRVCQAKQKIFKVFEHKPRIVELIGKYKNKRYRRAKAWTCRNKRCGETEQKKEYAP
ncbi:hypothetical protein V5799_002219 [Amblyomma americanum]|uniref:Histone deacetylase complex subunit SAP130 C-terminal domain-containing protein n=1 Tax=Amblyomma americanum TaxID=6943 RepID=A0AAQ4CXY8_AMBAM